MRDNVMEESSALNRQLLAAARILVGLGLIIALLSAVDVRLLLERFRAINARYLVLVLVLPHVAMVLSTIKWRILLDALGLRVRLGRLFSLYMIGTFFSNFLPTMVGGDVVRSYTLYRQTGDASSVLAATFLERFIGLTALISLLPLIIFQEPVRSVFPAVPVLVIGISLFYLLLSLLIISPIFGRIARWVPSKTMLFDRMLHFLRQTHSEIRVFARFKGCLFSSYVISIAFYLVTVTTTWIAAKSLGVSLDILYLVAIVPVVLLVAFLPVSFNGLGLTEAGYVLFFGLVDVSPEDALGIALLLRARLAVTALLGGLIFLCCRSDETTLSAPNKLRKGVGSPMPGQ